ncbi:MAG: hypothetical protein ACI4QJ_00215 [Candidatus Spyradenecus sp.]
MKRFWLMLLMVTRAVLALEGPQAYTFAHPEAKATWQQGLPEARQVISPTCVAVPEAGEVYLLAELTGLGEHYEVEFFLLGALSDRAYEGIAMAWDGPATVARALRAVGLSEGKPASLQRGLPLAQGERVTVAMRPAADPTAPFQPLSDFVNDQWSDPGQEVSARGFPFVGQCAADDVMPAAIAAAYTEAGAVLGLPFAAPKSQAYGMFRAKAGMVAGQSMVVRLKWEKLATPRVYHQRVEISAETLKLLDGLLAQLKALAEDPRDVFLCVRFAPELPVRDCIPLARLLVALEQQGAFVIDAPEPGQIPLRALLPDAAWNVREKRVFQPWEVELAPAEGGGVQATLCQILEDWTVDGPDPALTRQCYPGVTPQTIREVMDRVDVNDGKTYAVFFYLEPGITVGQVAPFTDALATPCPTQWIFCNSAGAPGGSSPPNP